MAFQRRLSDHQLIAARWEYEVTAISERDLAAKVGLSRSAIHAWITKQGWARAGALRCYDGEAGQRQFQRDVHAAIEAASNKKIIQTLEGSLRLAADREGDQGDQGCTPGQPDTTKVPAGWEMFPDQPQSSQNGSSAGSSGRRGAGDQDDQVVRFPGAYLPSRSLKPDAASTFPSRSRTAQAAMRVHLSVLGGELALQQIQQIERHDELLWDFRHLLAVYLNPGKFVDVAGLDPAQAAAKLEAIRHQVGRMVMPTERDTLAGAILAFSKALLASFAAKRYAAGPQHDKDEPEVRRHLSTLDLPSLRSVTAAMDLLRGDVRRHDEPAKPPPPEGLADLVVRRDPT